MKSRKFKSIWGSIVIASLLMLVACGSNETSNESSSDNNEDVQETFKLTYNDIFTQYGEEHGAYWLTDAFAEEIEKRSDGRIQVDVYHNSQLASPGEMMDALAAGTIDMALTAPQYYGDMIPAGFLGNLPYWSDSIDEAQHHMHETRVGELFHDDFWDYGAKPIGHYLNGQVGFILNQPIDSIEDMQNLVVRASGGMVNVWYEKMGVSGAEISIGETYDSIQRGVVDGTWTGFTALDSIKLGEIAKYIVKPASLESQVSTVFIAKSTWNKLPEDLQNLIVEVLGEMEQKGIEVNKAKEEKIPQMLEQYGVEEIILPDSENEKFKEAAMAAWDEFASLSERNAEIIKILREQ